ncbi:peptidylprolyl isomerase [Aliikangiella marina]|nr:peptidylprolyl isomerase [Aliikangiella marina]
MIHQIYELVDQRNAESLVFDQALQSQDKIIQKTALLGLARIGGQIALEKITPMLNNDSSELRKLAALGVGLSQQKNAAELLWQRLEKEKDLQVKHELYLGLGNLAPDNLITRMLARLDKEQQPETISAMFQGLAIALVFNRELKDDYQKIDYAKLLGLFAKGDTSHAMIGYFLNRIPGIENFLTVNDLLNISQQELSDEAKANLARLTAKITQKGNEKNREILAWLLEQSESSNIAVQQEALRAMRHLTSIPQALIQLGKHTKSTNPIVAHTALSTLANSELASEEMIALFKGQLKHQNDAMVVEAIRGLLKRQEKDEMSWVVQLLRHPSSYVKISLISQLNAKSQDDFKNTIKFFTTDPNKEVAAYAKRVVDKVATPKNVQAISPSFSEVSKTTNQIVTLKTTVGKIKIQLLESAPYTAWHFMRNAREGTFNNAYFSRVIGNFVAQGGDSIGDLSGASNQTIREEISFLNHEPMTVGMATSGKDTGTSQFFINTGRNFHLDRNYTVFGKVIEGQKAVIQMTNGAKILSIETN